ncbi:MAG: bifunctional isocitrate dehydrogenase kinase/phosphatase [Chromatiales bacterium]|nr:bifunctional isocitrate dehydrogenase kinase/phosphatase [Chromatiales bacterium]
MPHRLAKQIATTIAQGFERHFTLFQKITAGARDRFENAEWNAVQATSRERIDFYDQRVVETIDLLRAAFHISRLDEPLWKRVKVEYARLLHEHRQPELAETFYNSVFCRMFHRRYYNNDNIFVRPAVSTAYLEGAQPTYRTYFPRRDGIRATLVRAFSDFGFRRPWENLRRDLRNCVRVLRGRYPRRRRANLNNRTVILAPVFYRNKAGYIIGKFVDGFDEEPFVLAVLNNEQGALYLDAVVLGEQDTAAVFSFARAYFMVRTEVPSAVVDFLLALMPSKTRADLYTAIGLQKYGKTEFYRDFLRHLRHTDDELIVAPGIRGMVMLVFTLPSYPYVFKVIKDRFPAPKDTDRATVMAKYRLVKQHDRVGRMADSLEYSEAAFPVSRFSAELFDELQREAAENIYVDGDQLVIRHFYIERRMVPLNLYIAEADDGQLLHAMVEYGNAIRELASANVFPGDLLFKNFGVTRQNRVVFYDYDEIQYLTECNFRRIPPPRTPEDEFAAEPWYTVGPLDVFPEEFSTFLLGDPRLRKAFLKVNADLLDVEFWTDTQARIRAGQVGDVFPYPQAIRLPRGLRSATDSSL